MVIPVLLVPAVWGVLAALWTPRGPLTGAQALGSIVISAAVGVLAGRAARSRWPILLAPLLFVPAFELTRIRVSGPSVDPPHLSPIGVVVLLSGRVLHGFLSVVPMAAGAAWAHRRPARTRFRRFAGRALTGSATALTLALAVAATVPARTAPIPGGVAELTSVGGLGVMIRGRSPDLPVLLYVPGPPGGSDTGMMRTRLSGLEEHFVVATLDRRGGGASYPALGGRLTLDSEVADIVAVTDRLRQRFSRTRILLLGHSGGSIPAIVAAHRHPERFSAYVGTGQAVDLQASDRIFHQDMLAWARAEGRGDLVARLARQGPPPWADVYDYEPFLLHTNRMYGLPDPPFDLAVPESTLLQKAHTMTGMLDAWDALYPRLQAVDLHRDVPGLAIPAYFVQGGREMRGLAVPFASWYAALNAPDKRLVTIPDAGHRPMSDTPELFIAALTTLTGT
ncbi:alpha/beta fold hydrolase [Actinoplanes sp. G11-F43]|uniref:alpha/beta fold hydrolase n=1 Tax=Actinoplanes sp. G11-F43 TaxID=3424130 RepID=UPI003D34F3CA